MLLLHQRAILIGFTLLIYSLQGYTNVLAVDQIISEQEGKTVIVPCPVNKDKCGELHSLNWFKGDNRIAAMLLDDSNVTSVAEEFEDRVSVEQNPFRLIIRNLQISDEDIYLCDTTYFIPIETCDNFNGHRVELNVLVPPSEVVILDEKGDRIENGSIVGPMQERQTLKATCIVKNTRPQPQVGWWRGNKRLTTHSPSYDEKDGLFTATLELSLQLSRDDLGHSIECRAESAAIQNTIKNLFSVDLQVRPTTVTINGVEHHTVQGSKVVLTCDVHGARPPVNLTWFNASQPMDPEENDLMEIRTRAFEKEDGTYHTQSDLIFNASRFENDVKFVCQAENIVLQINREAPMQSLLTLEVLYPPVVKVSPPEITVNTSDTVLLNCEYVANPASLDHVIWYRNGEAVNVNDTIRYEGGNSENVALVIRSTDKHDIGNYTCQLSNSIGKGVSEQQIDLDVQFVPIVEVLMIPEGPVKESDESNVTLFCNIIDANPSVLTKVRWYANATLLKELPDCEETREDLCHIDPSKLLLESIGRGFFYNYSCEGYNAAGWGPRSEDKELLVHYEPGPATLTHFPLTAVKKKSVTFSCTVDDPGYPESYRYRWLRGGRGPLQDIVTKDWTVEPVGLDSRTNYSCYAFNEGGKGVMATVNLEVHAPPFFIKNLSPYTGVLHTSRNANLTCRIECVPRCEISWLKDGIAIEKNDTRYFVKDKYMDASPATGDFESMLSVLHFNMSNWPNKKFDIEGDNANYTCVSTGNTVGPGIKSATYFSIEYAPDNTTVSEETVYVQEETIPGRVICKSRANPEPTYEWRFNNKTVIRGNALIINTPMMRNDTGHYTCVAFNKHGSNTAETFIDVQYKPRCEIERQEIEDKDTLVCTAYGNPEEADFSWSIKAENETVEWLGNGDHKAFKDKSYYELKEDYAIARTYRCVANNTAGIGTFCEIEVAEQLGWWQRWDKTTLIILVASILLLLLAVIIICCIIICICRRRRRQDKYRTDVSMSATHSVLSYQPHMPQVLSANTVLPDTLKVPILSNMLLPAMAEQSKKTANLKANPIVITTTTETPATTTPIQTPILTKHFNATKTHVQSSNSSDKISTNNANNNEIHNKINSTTTPTTPITCTKGKTQTIVTITTPTSPSPATTVITTNSVTTPPLSIRSSQVPKSPPRWPLRPGVMVHVSSDTKENLAVNRMTLKPTATLTANLTASTLNDSSLSSSTLNNSAANTTQTTLLNVTRQSSTLGRIGRQGRVQLHDPEQDLALKVESNEHNNNAPQQQLTLSQTLPLKGKQATNLNVKTKTQTINSPTTPTDRQAEEVSKDMELAATNSNEIESFSSNREQEILASGENQNEYSTGLAEVTQVNHPKLTHFKKLELFFTNIFFKRSNKRVDGCRDSQRSHVGLLGGKFWKRTEAATATTSSSKSPFSTEHRLKGIRSSGSVTYKKCAKTTTATSTNLVATNTCATTTITDRTLNENNNDLSHLNQTGINTNTTQAQTQTQQPTTTQVIMQTVSQQQQQQHPLPVSMTSMSPSLNTNHPPHNEQNVQDPVSVIMPGDKSTTTVIQSIPSTIVTSRELKRTASQNSQRKGILKAPTPPPRPPPITRTVVTSLKRTASHAKSQKVERIQTVQEKSSSMADPLTEPGEYENLPFHGLQTAPNKFTTPTTPTNFNNNTNVVRSVPRPKRLNGNISQNAATAPTATTTQETYYDEQETDTQQQQQYYHQQQQYSTMPYNRHQQHPATTTASAHMTGMQTLIPNSTNRNEGGGIIVHNSNNSTLQQQQNGHLTNSNAQQMTYNLNNCFPKSYTEYYHQQQQQQQQQHQQQHPPSQQHQQFSQKFNNSAMALTSTNLINAIEHDMNTYAVVERQQNPNADTPKATASSVAVASTTNPFLAVSNFKKFDTSGEEDLHTGNYQTASMKRQGKRKTFADKLEDKRFYSLKFSSNNNKQKSSNKSSTATAALNLNHSFNGTPGGGGGGGAVGAISSLLSSSAGKCKRHHSFAGGSLGDIDPKGPVRNTHMNFYDPPAYENVNDAIQIHSVAVSDMELPEDLACNAQTATVLLHPLPYGIQGGSQGPKKKHHQRQHQPKEDLNLIEPERLSIYRSDSGISNSSYECVTPLASSTQTPGSTPPPGKMPRTPKTSKTPKSHKNQTLAHTAVTAHFNSSHKKPAPRVPTTPLYMNLNEQQQTTNNISNLERPNSPTSTMATSAYESASSSQNDNTCNDPISLSSTTSLYSGAVNKSSLTAINQRCNRHQQPPEITTPEEFEQYQLGHHAHAHSSSSLSVASSISASGSNTGAGSRIKCKKQQQQQRLNHLELNKRKPLAHNPFLATKPAASATTTCHKKLHRRQTISDPYAHIKHINECRRQSNNTNNDNCGSGSFCSSSNNNYQTYNYGTKSPNTFKTTTAANDCQSSATTCGANKSQQQQQIGLQQYNKTKQLSSSPLPHSPASTTSCPQYAAHHQQMLMHKNVVNNSKITIDDNGRPYNEVVIHVVGNENNVANATNHVYRHQGDQSFNIPHRSLNFDIATTNNDKKQHEQANEVVRRSHNRSLSNNTNLMATLEDATTAPLGFMERPVKLPLRKYHSFHFQPTQTVTGQQISKLQQLQQQHLQSNFNNATSLTQPYAHQGPLVFRPYQIDENVTFKPIQPSEESEDSLDYVKEYVGTVEKFLKDEEKYMDSGDFTNLTQRLKQQQDFLKSNKALSCDDKIRESCSDLKDEDSLYEDLTVEKKESVGEQDFTHKIPNDIREKTHHSSRALNLLRAVIESDSVQSEDDLEIIVQKSNFNTSLMNSPKTGIFKSPIKNFEVLKDKRFSGANDLFVSNKSPASLSKVSTDNNNYNEKTKSPDKIKSLATNSGLCKPSLESESTIKHNSKGNAKDPAKSPNFSTSSLRDDNFYDREGNLVKNSTIVLEDIDKSPKSPVSSKSVNFNKSPNSSRVSSLAKHFLDNEDHQTHSCKHDFENLSNSSKISILCKQISDDENNFFLNKQLKTGDLDKSPKVSTLGKLSKENKTNKTFDIPKSHRVSSTQNISTVSENKPMQKSDKRLPDFSKSPKSKEISFCHRQSSDKDNNNVIDYEDDLRDLCYSANSAQILTFNQFKQNNPKDFVFSKENMKISEDALRFTQFQKSPQSNESTQISSTSNLKGKTEHDAGKPLANPRSSFPVLSKRSLNFSLDNDNIKDSFKEVSTDSVLTDKDLEKVFKPYNKQQERIPCTISTALNPAASLEALEMLTKSNPELWSSNQAGSRHNLHQLELFHTLQQQNKNQKTKEDDEEDLGYSFCEDENDEEEQEAEKDDPPSPSSPHVTVIMSPNSRSATQVKYILTQNHGEVHI